MKKNRTYPRRKGKKNLRKKKEKKKKKKRKNGCRPRGDFRGHLLHGCFDFRRHREQACSERFSSFPIDDDILPVFDGSPVLRRGLLGEDGVVGATALEFACALYHRLRNLHAH